MKSFRCVCGNRLHFGNTRCLSCGRALGFVGERRTLTPLEPRGDAWLALAWPQRPPFRHCANRQAAQCDWLVPAASGETLCLSCRLTEVLPDLSVDANQRYWSRLEAAKRYLICDLVRLGLPIESRRENPQRGLVFHFLAGEESELGRQPVITGHAEGRITIDVVEADDVHRERMRVLLGEAYRTLLGHLRHESGHYYWLRLLADSPQLAEFRSLFGDERVDYGDAVAAYYAREPGSTSHSPDYISAYATAHPWEDWAETWAHYLHITDAIETAWDFGLTTAPPERSDTAGLLRHWTDLSLALNAMARGLGLSDLYPFVITPAVAEKLAFVGRVIDGHSRQAAEPAPSY